MTRNPDGSIRGWDPHGVDDLAKPCYDYKGISGALGFLRELNDALGRLGWGVYQTDHEDANFQYEVNFRYADALATADRLTFFRMMAGQLAQRSGAIATFMAKPFSTRTGSGAHMHYHLADAFVGQQSVPRRVGPPRPGPLGAGLSLHRRRARPCPGPLRGHVADGQLLQAAADGARTHRLAFRLYLDAGLHLLRRQQPDPDAPRPRGRAISRIGRSRAPATPTSASRPTLPPGWTASPASSIPASPTSAISTRRTSKPWPAAACVRSRRACPRPWLISSATSVVRESLGPIADELSASSATSGASTMRRSSRGRSNAT